MRDSFAKAYHAVAVLQVTALLQLLSRGSENFNTPDTSTGHIGFRCAQWMCAIAA